MIAIRKFLGEECARPGPFALLDIAPEACTNTNVIAALEQQLDRIDTHPQGDTPEAEEVRLALHAAAAQLLDPVVRRHLLQTVRPDLTPPAAEPAPAAHTTRAQANGASMVTLEQDAILTLARFGGINAQSMRRLAALAHARGLDGRHAAQALQHLARRRPMNVERRTADSAEPDVREARRPVISQETAAVVEQARRSRAWHAAIIGGMLLLSLVSLFVLIIVAIARPAVPTRVIAREETVPAPVESAEAPETRTAQPEETAAPKPRPLITERSELLSALRAARGALSQDPQAALADFTLALRSLAAAWPALSEGERRAAHHAVLDFLYAAAPWPDVTDAVLDSITAPSRRLAPDLPALEAGEVAPAIWSAGMLARLAEERELPVRLTGRIRVALAEAVRDTQTPIASFADGARIAAAAAPLAVVRNTRTTDNPEAAAEAARAWAAAVAALAHDGTARDRMLADGLERVLLNAAEPSADPRVLAFIRAAVLAISFEEGSPARARLVDWFRHPRISSDDLAEVTGTLVTSTAVPGLDSTMVLSRAAGRDDRLTMALAYALAWDMEAAALTDALAQRWIETARTALDDTDLTADPIEQLERTVRLARLNEAARRLWRGERDGLDPILDLAASPTQATSPNLLTLTYRLGESSRGADGNWALRYRAARQNIPVRLELLDELARVGGAIGPIDAEVLAEEAFFGTPIDRIRPRAQEIVVQFEDDPAMILAVLEVLPRKRVRTSIARMVSSLAGERLGAHEDPLWEHRARRALVRRALELLAAEGGRAQIDPLAAALSASYRRRAGRADRAASPVSPARAAEELIIAARDIWDVAMLDADALTAHDAAPIPLDLIHRRRRGRQTLARGPTQMFFAEQVSIAELLAWTVAGEQRSRAAGVATIVEDMTTERQSARHIYTQMEAAERAMLRLWLIRFGEDES